LGEIEKQMKNEQMKNEKMKKEQMKKEQMKYKQQQQLDKHNEEILNRIKNDKSNDVIAVSKRPTINNLTALLKESSQTKPKGGYKKSIRTRKNTKNNKSFRRKSNKIVKYKRVKYN
jgi:hypothetical protein